MKKQQKILLAAGLALCVLAAGCGEKNDTASPAQQATAEPIAETAAEEETTAEEEIGSVLTKKIVYDDYGVTTTTYGYFADGKEAGSKTFIEYEDGTCSGSRELKSYNEQGLLKTVCNYFININAGAEENERTTTYFYDDEGVMTRAEIVISDGRNITDEYDKNGNVVRSTEKDTGSDTVSVNEYSYDEQGRLLTETVAYGDEPAGVITRCEYDDATGTVKVMYEENEDFAYSTKTETETNGNEKRTTYDAQGNVSSVAEYDPDGLILNETDYWYIEDGNTEDADFYCETYSYEKNEDGTIAKMILTTTGKSGGEQEEESVSVTEYRYAAENLPTPDVLEWTEEEKKAGGKTETADMSVQLEGVWEYKQDNDVAVIHFGEDNAFDATIYTGYQGKNEKAYTFVGTYSLKTLDEAFANAPDQKPDGFDYDLVVALEEKTDADYPFETIGSFFLMNPVTGAAGTQLFVQEAHEGESILSYYLHTTDAVFAYSEDGGTVTVG